MPAIYMPSAWDSQVLDRKAGRLVFAHPMAAFPAASVAEAMRLAHMDAAVFLHARADAARSDQAAALQAVGFRHVSTLLNIRLRLPAPAQQAERNDPGVVIWEAEGADKQWLSEAAGAAFQFGTRIANDPNLGTEIAKRFYAAWMHNADIRHVLIGRLVAVPRAGFVLWRSEPGGVGRLVLLVVSAEARNRGIARALVRSALLQMTQKGYGAAVGGVEIASHSAMNLYWSMGFQVDGAAQQYHWHAPKEAP